MKYSEEHGYLADKQHGGRKVRASIDVVALNRFTAETHHYQQSNAGRTNCNGKACYDRITPKLLALLYAKVGCPPQAIELLYSALTQLEYTMITAIGTSGMVSKSTLNNILFRIGQEATDGLPGWTYHTNTLSMMYTKRAGGSTLSNPSKNHHPTTKPRHDC
eukprot:385322-Ditylum_brightwellii.AAC.1